MLENNWKILDYGPSVDHSSNQIWLQTRMRIVWAQTIRNTFKYAFLALKLTVITNKQKQRKKENSLGKYNGKKKEKQWAKKQA